MNIRIISTLKLYQQEHISLDKVLKEFNVDEFLICNLQKLRKQKTYVFIISSSNFPEENSDALKSTDPL